MHRGCPSALRRCSGRTLMSAARALTPTRQCVSATPWQPLLRSLASVLAIMAGKRLPACTLAMRPALHHCVILIQHTGCSYPRWT